MSWQTASISYSNFRQYLRPLTSQILPVVPTFQLLLQASLSQSLSRSVLHVYAAARACNICKSLSQLQIHMLALCVYLYVDATQSAIRLDQAPGNSSVSRPIRLLDASVRLLQSVHLHFSSDAHTHAQQQWLHTHAQLASYNCCSCCCSHMLPPPCNLSVLLTISIYTWPIYALSQLEFQLITQV